MATALMVLILGAAGLVLLLIGTTIQFRNRSPYSNTPIDQESRKRIGVGASIALLGSLLSLLANGLNVFWQ